MKPNVTQLLKELEEAGYIESFARRTGTHTWGTKYTYFEVVSTYLTF